jgi:hypothetical protein
MREPEYPRPYAGRPLYRLLVLAVAGAALLAGIGAGAWLLTERHDSPPQAGPQRNSQPSGPVISPADAPAADGSVASGSPGPGGATAVSTAPGTAVPAAGASAPGPVAIAPAVAGNATAAPIAAFLDEYFDAINNRDYQAYVALRSPQAQGLTQAQFDVGYASTTDNDETLDGISSAANGDSIAQVTFTSQQSAANSATNSTCTTWNISLYLVPTGDGYLIDNPPADYHAAYAACG